MHGFENFFHFCHVNNVTDAIVCCRWNGVRESQIASNKKLWWRRCKNGFKVFFCQVSCSAVKDRHLFILDMDLQHMRYKMESKPLDAGEGGC